MKSQQGTVAKWNVSPRGPAGALLVLSLAAVASALQAPARPVAGELEEVLTQARAAAGRSAWAELGSDLAFAGTARISGVEDGFALTFSETGNYRFQTEGPLANTSTWDGSTGWTKDAGGPPRQLSLETLDQSRLSQWVHSGYWCSESAPLQIRLVGEDSKGVNLELLFEGSHRPAHLLLAADTWLPLELRQGSIGGEQSLLFEDYRKVCGVPISHRLTFRGSGVEGYVHVASGKRASESSVDLYSLESAETTDTKFHAERPSVIDLRRLRSGHLLVQAVVNGSDPRWFILDTGAGKMCIDPRFADELDLVAFGEVPAVGIGGTVIAKFRQGGSIELGPMEISNPVFLELDLSFLEPHFGVAVSGICGYELFARSILELDLSGPTAALFDPAEFELDEDAWQPMLLNANIPCIEGRFEGEHSGFFAIDTGDPGTVSFHTAVVTRLDLLKGREVRKTRVGGVGGRVDSCSGKLDWIELGGKRFESIDANFGLSEQGVRTGGAVLGTLGSRLLHPFVILFDYSGGRIALIPK